MSESRLTFFSKNPLSCPVCDANFYREELFTGRGRLNAGELTNELRRLYEPSRKYGEVVPLIYAVIVCPACSFAAYPQDFAQVPDRIIDTLHGESDRRASAAATIFPELDFEEPRRLEEGVASYLFAIMSYERFPKEFSPTFKCGVSALRAAWLFADLHRKRMGENYDYLSLLFYHKARFFYSLTVEREQNGTEALGGVQNYGPDLDKNYGYDGLLYLSGLLEFRYGDQSDPEKRKARLAEAKRTVARIFGMGKASKDKPSAILDKAKDLFGEISAEMKEDPGDVA